MKSLVIFVAVLAVLAAVQAQPFLGLDLIEKTVSSVAGGVIGGATGILKGGVKGIEGVVKDGIGGLGHGLFSKKKPSHLFDI